MKKAELINKWQEKAKWCFESMKMNEDNSEYKRELAAKIDVYNDVILDIKELEEPEQEKPVIPQFVADWIEKQKKAKNGLLWALIEGSERELITKWLLIDNYQEKSKREDLMLRAWLDGYTVEKEKLYRVKLLPINRGYLAQWDGTSLQTGYADEHECYENCKTIFTEQEIKAFDERFWTFAEEVTK